MRFRKGILNFQYLKCSKKQRLFIILTWKDFIDSATHNKAHRTYPLHLYTYHNLSGERVRIATSLYYKNMKLSCSSKAKSIMAKSAYSSWGILSRFSFRLSVFRQTIEGMLPSIICFHRCLSTTYAQVLKHTRRSENVHATNLMLRHNSGTLARIATVSIMIYLSCTLVFVPPCQDLHDRSLQHMHARMRFTQICLSQALHVA